MSVVPGSRYVYSSRPKVNWKRLYHKQQKEHERYLKELIKLLEKIQAERDRAVHRLACRGISKQGGERHTEY